MTIDKPLPEHLRQGQAAEQAACEFLQAQGLRIVARNVRLRAGEIDIVAREGAAWVFVEVRWRRSAVFGGAPASINARKRARLRRAAQQYLQQFTVLPPARIDALCLTGGQPGLASSAHQRLLQWEWLRGV